MVASGHSFSDPCCSRPSNPRIHPYNSNTLVQQYTPFTHAGHTTPPSISTIVAAPASSSIAPHPTTSGEFVVFPSSSSVPHINHNTYDNSVVTSGHPNFQLTHPSSALSGQYPVHALAHSQSQSHTHPHSHPVVSSPVPHPHLDTRLHSQLSTVSNSQFLTAAHYPTTQFPTAQFPSAHYPASADVRITYPQHQPQHPLDNPTQPHAHTLAQAQVQTQGHRQVIEVLPPYQGPPISSGSSHQTLSVNHSTSLAPHHSTAPSTQTQLCYPVVCVAQTSAPPQYSLASNTVGSDHIPSVPVAYNSHNLKQNRSPSVVPLPSDSSTKPRKGKFSRPRTSKSNSTNVDSSRVQPESVVPSTATPSNKRPPLPSSSKATFAAATDSNNQKYFADVGSDTADAAVEAAAQATAEAVAAATSPTGTMMYPHQTLNKKSASLLPYSAVPSGMSTESHSVNIPALSSNSQAPTNKFTRYSSPRASQSHNSSRPSNSHPPHLSISQASKLQQNDNEQSNQRTSENQHRLENLQVHPTRQVQPSQTESPHPQPQSSRELGCSNQQTRQPQVSQIQPELQSQIQPSCVLKPVQVPTPSSDQPQSIPQMIPQANADPRPKSPVPKDHPEQVLQSQQSGNSQKQPKQPKKLKQKVSKDHKSGKDKSKKLKDRTISKAKHTRQQQHPQHSQQLFQTKKSSAQNKEALAQSTSLPRLPAPPPSMQQRHEQHQLKNASMSSEAHHQHNQRTEPSEPVSPVPLPVLTPLKPQSKQQQVTIMMQPQEMDHKQQDKEQMITEPSQPSQCPQPINQNDLVSKFDQNLPLLSTTSKGPPDSQNRNISVSVSNTMARPRSPRKRDRVDTLSSSVVGSPIAKRQRNSVPSAPSAPSEMAVVVKAPELKSVDEMSYLKLMPKDTTAPINRATETPPLNVGAAEDLVSKPGSAENSVSKSGLPPKRKNVSSWYDTLRSIWPILRSENEGRARFTFKEICDCIGEHWAEVRTEDPPRNNRWRATMSKCVRSGFIVTKSGERDDDGEEEYIMPGADSEPSRNIKAQRSSKQAEGSVEDDKVIPDKDALRRVVPKEHFVEVMKPVRLSEVDKARGIQFEGDPSDNLVRGFKGYRTIRANSGVSEGDWYFELKLLDYEGDGAVRLGWGLRRSDVETPIGSDHHGFGIRDRSGEMIRKGRRIPYGEAFGKGDCIGCRIVLPSLTDEEKEQIAMANCRWLKYRFVRFSQGPQPPDSGIDIRGKGYVEFFKNGVSMGVSKYFTVPEAYFRLDGSNLGWDIPDGDGNSNDDVASSQSGISSPSAPSVMKSAVGCDASINGFVQLSKGRTGHTTSNDGRSKEDGNTGPSAIERKHKVIKREMKAGVYFPSISLFGNAKVQANFGPDFAFPPPVDSKSLSEVAADATSTHINRVMTVSPTTQDGTTSTGHGSTGSDGSSAQDPVPIPIDREDGT